MHIDTDFEIIPDLYGKAAPASAKTLDTPTRSFPFVVRDIPQGAQYLHWAFADPDSIPVCGFEWIHWTAANVPIAALEQASSVDGASSANGAGSSALNCVIPEDFSHTLEQDSRFAQVVQGRTSQASRFVGGTDPAVTMHYNGPQPPDQDHEYWLRVWATAEPLDGLHEGFWLNALTRQLRGDKQHLDNVILGYSERFLIGLA